MSARYLLCLFIGHAWREASGIVRRHCARCGFTPLAEEASA